MSTPYALVAATLDHLTRFAPFSQMPREHLVWMIERLKVGYYARDEAVLAPGADPVHTFYVIKQGVVRGEQEVTQGQEDGAWLELHEGECFPLGALFAQRGVTSTYRAGTDAVCYELAAADFHALLHRCPVFQDFCSRRIATLLEQSKQVIQAQGAKSGSDQDSMSSPLAALIRRQPITCPPQTPLREALETMHQHGIGSLVAVDAEGRPAGIFTLHDMLSRVVLPGLDLARPLADVMTPTLHTLPPQAFAFEAALTMARHDIRHVLVTEHGRLKGLVSEKDLFSLQRVGLRQISANLRSAHDLTTLISAAGDIRQLANHMLAQGASAEQLTRIISTLNDLLTTRVLELELAASPLAGIDFCWIALGSEGRLEQTLNTDQDNGIIFTLPEGESAQALRELLLPFARRVNEALDACGFPLCKGGVMASNPQWCLSLEEWQTAFGDWIFRGDGPVLLNASIFFDFRPIMGEAHLAHSLRSWLNGHVRNQRQFLRLMVQNALGNRPPLGLARDFVLDGAGDEAHTLEMKLHGSMPFVDAARIFALAAGVDETGTAPRLQAAGAVWKLDPQEVAAWVDSFFYIQQLRLRTHQDQLARNRPLSNRLDPETLSAVERQTLKESFRQAKKLQSRMESFFQF